MLSGSEVRTWGNSRTDLILYRVVIVDFRIVPDATFCVPKCQVSRHIVCTYAGLFSNGDDDDGDDDHDDD